MVLFGLFLILTGITPGDWAVVFAVLGFVSLVFWIRKGLALWPLDRLVFDGKAFASTTRRQTAGVSLRRGRQGSVARSETPPHPAF